MWKIVIQMRGEEPSEAEVEAAEEAVVKALDEGEFDYEDVYAQ